MSVGHVSRAIEEAGIPTIALSARPFRHVPESMRPPRVLITQHMVGRTVSAPFDVERQRDVLLRAFKLLEEAGEGGTIWEMDGEYRPGPAPA